MTFSQFELYLIYLPTLILQKNKNNIQHFLFKWYTIHNSHNRIILI